MTTDHDGGSFDYGEDLVKQPILHSPSVEPDRHWRTEGHLTHNEIIPGRRQANEPFPTGQAVAESALTLDFDGVNTNEENLGLGPLESLRDEVRNWRKNGYPKTTQRTQTFLNHLAAGNERERSHNLFFAQREAIETIVFLTEFCSPQHKMIKRLRAASNTYNDGLIRLAMRMATGTGKTAVMACIISYYAINRKKVRDHVARLLSRNIDRIIVVCPGRTVRERLQVLDPRRVGNIYDEWQLLPDSLRPKLNGIKVNIVNFEKLQPYDGIDLVDIDVAKKGMSKTQLNTVLGRKKGGVYQETHHEMWSRILRLHRGHPKERAIVLNDEGHHCWNRQKNAQQGVWMGALQSLRDHPITKLSQVIDLTATPIFINPRQAEGYKGQNASDDLFPWIVSEFALAESMESGLVKIPRLPAAGQPSNSGRLRNLYDLTGGKPLTNKEALRAVKEAAELLYIDYKRTFEMWASQGDPRLGEPVFIAVVNNKKNAEILFHTFGGSRQADHQLIRPSSFDLFSNIPQNGCSDDECEMRTILVVSKTQNPEKVEGGVSVNNNSSQLGISPLNGKEPSIEEIQEVLQTVGQPGKPGSSVRCVVSVGMLTEGWDCQRVTHIFGYRKFGSQLLCEQVLGRALRRQDYDNQITVRRSDNKVENERYPAEYATVIGVPFQTWSHGVNGSGGGEKNEVPPTPVTEVYPVASRADKFTIWVPDIEDYRLQVPQGRLKFAPDEVDKVILGKAAEHLPRIDKTVVEGPLGESEKLDRIEMCKPNNGVWRLAADLVGRCEESNLLPQEEKNFRSGELFVDCLNIAKTWLVHSSDEDWTDELLMQNDAVRQTIIEALMPAIQLGQQEKALPIGIPTDQRQPLRSASKWRQFSTRLKHIQKVKHSELNVAACHSILEKKIAGELDGLGLVAAFTRNHGPQQIEIPYRHKGAIHKYIPDYFLRLRGGQSNQVTHVILEVKGMPDEKSERKMAWTKAWWIPAANEIGKEYKQDWIFVEVQPNQEVERRILEEMEAHG